MGRVAVAYPTCTIDVQRMGIWQKSGKAFPLEPEKKPEATYLHKSRFFKYHDTPSDRARQVREADAGMQQGDRRFYRKVEDYREIQDGDPLSGLFKEKTTTVKTRLRAWREQFEKENEGVELPYERTSMAKRLVPNWFMRHLLSIREAGGLRSLKPLNIMLLFLFLCIFAWCRFHYGDFLSGRQLKFVQ